MSDIHVQPLGFSIGDACTLSSLGRTKLYQLIGDGTLKTAKIGRRTIIIADSLRELISGDSSRSLLASGSERADA